jgi:NSS family neurotransmitter:Na+ symporter
VLLLALLPTFGYSLLSWIAIPVGSASMTILDFMDFISNSVLMPLAALLLCLMIGWGLKPSFVKAEVESTPGVKMGRYRIFKVMIKFIAPVFMLVILVSSVLNAVGLVSL